MARVRGNRVTFLSYALLGVATLSVMASKADAQQWTSIEPSCAHR